jgi:ATP-dependent RNA helicase DeaD
MPSIMSASLPPDAPVSDATDQPLDDGGFAALGLRPELLSAVTALGYEEPTPIQRAAIPVLREGRDVLGLAATGTGKTAAFALPLLDRIADARNRDGAPAALVLVPTRELAMQVAEAVHKYGRPLGMRVVPIYGGAPMGRQLAALERGVDVVVATPGRALDHLGRGTLRLDSVRVVVLDEADEMLDMGFEDELRAILEATPTERQTALFSATMAPQVVKIANAHLREPARVEIAREPMAAGTMPKVRQTAYVVPRAHKLATLGRVLDIEAPTSAIVFCRTRTEVDELTETLAGRGWSAEALHGGMGQEARDRVMRRFRGGQLELLVATDVAARGLDVEHVSHVVNYDVPSAPEAYVHRIGRTGRAGREGAAVTIAEPREHRLLRNIERLTGQKIEFATVPTVADLRARRLDLTRAAVQDALVAAQSDPSVIERFRVVVETLANEFDLMDVAAAAISVAHEATTGDTDEDEVEIPTVTVGEYRGGGRTTGRYGRLEHERGRGPASRERFGRFGGGEESERPERGERPERSERPERGERYERAERGPRPERFDRGDRGERRGGRDGGGTTRVYVGAGRKSGIRPADLVGAIANEAGIQARSIGAIEIADRFSLVEVPESVVDAVIDALRGTTVKGKRVVVRRDRA